MVQLDTGGHRGLVFAGDQKSGTVAELSGKAQCPEMQVFGKDNPFQILSLGATSFRHWVLLVLGSQNERALSSAIVFTWAGTSFSSFPSRCVCSA